MEIQHNRRGFEMTKEWIKKQENVYSNEGFDEPDRLINNLGTKTESRFEVLITILDELSKSNKSQISVLEAGCASGAIANYIAEKFKKVYVDALDLPKVINKIKKKHHKVNLITMDLNKKFPQFKYDVIYATGVIEHLYNDWFFIKSCFDQLKQGGFLIITAPMLETMFGQKDSLHIRIYPKNMLEGLLELAGFKIKKSWEEDGRKRIIGVKDGRNNFSKNTDIKKNI